MRHLKTFEKHRPTAPISLLIDAWKKDKGYISDILNVAKDEGITAEAYIQENDGQLRIQIYNNKEADNFNDICHDIVSRIEMLPHEITEIKLKRNRSGILRHFKARDIIIKDVKEIYDHEIIDFTITIKNQIDVDMRRHITNNFSPEEVNIYDKWDKKYSKGDSH